MPFPISSGPPPLRFSARALERLHEEEERISNGVRPGGLSAGHLPGNAFRTAVQPLSRVHGKTMSALELVKRGLSFHDLPLRKYVLDSQRGFICDPLRPVPMPPASPRRFLRSDVTPTPQVEQVIGEAKAARDSWLLNLSQAPTNEQVVTEDLSFRPSAYLMGGQNPVDLAFAEQLSAIGECEGFKIIYLMGPKREGDGKFGPNSFNPSRHTEVLHIEGGADPWTEDQGECTIAGGFSIPASIAEDGFLKAAIDEGRAGRLPERLRGFGRQSEVDARGSQRQMVSASIAEGVPLRQNLTYLEGGNVLPGVLPSGEGYALVGRDSVCIARALLERDIRRETGTAVVLTEGQVLEAIAKDLGIKAEHVIPVEQPGRFHLDMAMGLFKPGMVVLNDSRAAAEKQVAWLKEDYLLGKPSLPLSATPEAKARYEREMTCWEGEAVGLDSKIADTRASATRNAHLEDLTAKDLEGHGLTVHRAALCFDYEDRKMNFLNSVKGTNPQGRSFCVSLGGDPRAEAFFLEEMKRLDSGISNFYFLDRTITDDSLSQSGGINCRTKAHGTMLAPRVEGESVVDWS